MDVRLIKLSDHTRDRMTGKDTLAIHLGYFKAYGQVTFTTSLSVASKPDYVLFVSSNDDPDFYWCHVKAHESQKEPFISEKLNKYSPAYYESNPENETWFLLDSMERIDPILMKTFLAIGTEIDDFSKTPRANNKKFQV